MVPRLVIATTNAGKLREYRELLAELPLPLASLADYPPQPEVVEDGETFAANAVKKAQAWATALGEPVLADDSGLVVDALGGAPGVHSARFAGPQHDDAANLAKLLALMAAVPEEFRSARFECVVAVVRGDGATLTARGTCEGRISSAARGGGGFGYDPIFVPNDWQQTFAELGAADKNRLSHRARALAELKPSLSEFLGP